MNDGYVIGVEILPNFGNSVLVHHGGFYTVYGNLSEIYVRKDQVLSRNDVIGLSGDENSLIGEVLFFMVREGTTDLNPEEWLQRAGAVRGRRETGDGRREVQGSRFKVSRGVGTAKYAQLGSRNIEPNVE